MKKKLSHVLFLLSVICLNTVFSEEALQRLIEGNKRYTQSKTICHEDWDVKRTTLLKAQRPFSVIISCSDSRVPPEIIFDQTLGDLFVIRLAGNVVDELALGSIEYGVTQLKASLIMVLGHSNCGALDAALKEMKFDNHIQSIINALQPAIKSVQEESGDRLEKAIKSNVRHVVSQLKSAQPVLAPLVSKESLKIIGGYYKLDSGQVELID